MTDTDPSVLVGLRAKHIDIMLAVREAKSETVIPFSLDGIVSARNVLSSLDLPVHYAVVTPDVYSRFIGSRWFIQVIEPVTKHEMLMIGKLGSMLGMDVLSPMFFHPIDRIFDFSTKGVFAVVSVTQNRGVRVYRTRFADDD